MSKLNHLIHNQHNWWRDWEHFWAIFHKLARQDDLENLVAWARRKRLTGQASYYNSLLTETAIDLNRYAVREHQRYLWANRLYTLHRLINPSRKKHPHGSAAMYRRR